MKAHENVLQPINEAHEWKKSGLDAIQPPLAPKKSAGRPKKNRRKSKIEVKVVKGKLQRTGMMTYNCRSCGQVGHNKRRCPLKGSAPSKVKLKKDAKKKGKQSPQHVQQKKEKEKQKIKTSMGRASRKIKSNFKSNFINGPASKKGVTIQEPNEKDAI
ncbi:hypothetical protein PTKIN_Ptkin19aG0067200 [Pterospermum kingtungense]